MVVHNSLWFTVEYFDFLNTGIEAVSANSENLHTDISQMSVSCNIGTIQFNTQTVRSFNISTPLQYCRHPSC